MSIRKIVKKVVDKAEDAVVGKTERDIQDVERGKDNEAGK